MRIGGAMARLSVQTRMALQMLVALALAFTLGMVAFGQHWAWVVLTAFIVCSGAVGRGDAIYKGVLRLAGALAGTLVAAAVSRLSRNGIESATLIFVALFFGIWLRNINYAYWAACATLIFALLQGSAGIDPLPLFAIRLLAIVAGALCAIVATWFVYPIQTEALVRKRVGEARDALRAGAGVRELHFHLAQLERVAPPVRLHRRVFGEREDGRHPATLIELMQGRLRAVIERAKVRVCISVAVSLDGYIDDRSPQRLILSSPEDLEDMREAREQCDAILVGAGTVRRDNPSLRAKNAARVTVTRSGELDSDLHFFDGTMRTIVLTAPERVDALREQLGECAEIIAIESFEPASYVGALRDCGVRSLFVEGGTRILTAFLAGGTFDRLRLAISPFFVGDDDAPRMVHATRFLNDAHHRLALTGVRKLGDVAVLDYEHPPA
jgi:5-amino-6-(5-phosphoribosylamino)uracil reductase